MVKVSNLSYHKEPLLKERIHSLWEQILSFKRSSILKRDAIKEYHCLIQYSPFGARSFLSVLTAPLKMIAKLGRKNKHPGEAFTK